MAGGGQDAPPLAGLVNRTIVDGLRLTAAGGSGQILQGFQHGTQVNNRQRVEQDLRKGLVHLFGLAIPACTLNENSLGKNMVLVREILGNIAKVNKYFNLKKRLF